ncbi:MAG: DUF3365 domain-containing protein [bacterium]|nr:DUF3365 domain-containing protein [bacterium]
MRFRTILFLAALAALAAAAGCGDKAKQAAPAAQQPPATTAAASDHAAELTACRTAVDRLGQALRGALQEAIAANGAIGALEVCNIEALPLTKTISTEEGVIIGRTSLRVRNPGNAPDEWEQARLAEFATRKAAGEDLGAMEVWEVVDDAAGHKTFRYLKAIGTAPMCLQCHGSELATDVGAAVKKLYPDDAATGFAVGDLRGAFTVSKPLS